MKHLVYYFEQSRLDVVLNDVASVDCNECTNHVNVHDVNNVAVVNDAAVITNDTNEKNDVLVEQNKDCLVSCELVAKEQRGHSSLRGCFKLAEKRKGKFVMNKGILYHQDKVLALLSQPVSQLVVPVSRRTHVLEMGHDTHGGHMGAKGTIDCLHLLVASVE